VLNAAANLAVPDPVVSKQMTPPHSQTPTVNPLLQQHIIDAGE
jgi:hypothetical protein